jgi:hypothetical protein
MKSGEESVPRAREEGLLIQELPDELLVYDRIRHKAHCLNQTAALVWKYCDGTTNINQLTRILSKETGSPVGEEFVFLAFDQLAKAHLLQGEQREWQEAPGISRREVIRRIGAAAAVALPLVSSITAPEAVQAATCVATGGACTTSAQCCTLVCNAGTCA